jgi:type IV pilus assembly protein PilC
MPQFIQIFTKAGVELPLPTVIMYQTGLFVKQYWMFYIPILMAIFFGAKTFLKTAQGKNFSDHLILKIPVLGPLVNKSLVARFTRTLATMLNTGVPMLQGLAIVEQVVENNVYAKIVREVYHSTERGDGLYKALLSRSEIPKDVTYMVSVGEKSGNIGAMLNKIADFYESKVQYEVKDLMVMIEPMFISVLGVVVGGILASMILPMFDMVKTIQR